MDKLLEEIWKLDVEEQLLIAKAILERAEASGMPHSIEFEDEQIWYQRLLAEQEKAPQKVVPWEDFKAKVASDLTSAQARLLKQRLAEARNSPEAGYSWPEAKAMIQNRES
jgi:hypothetical protein